ncbi:MAG: flagellin [Butyrivibrio sp.]|nr:flagellin [Butyrivibrio sp.]
MTGISSVSGYSAYSPYSVISNGGTYTRAAQGASELAIQEKTKSQTTGLDAGAQNLTSAKSALNVEDGAMQEVTEYLQSIKELSVKASNGTLSDSDRRSIQDQIDQYKKGIDDIAGNTTYNEKKLLDGTTPDMRVASDNNGSEEVISSKNVSLKALGIEDYDVTSGDFDMSRIDKAIESLSKARSDAGATTNRVEHALTYNSHAAMELNGYQMNKEEQNVSDAISALKTKQALDAYQVNLQKKQQEDKERQSTMLFG